MMMIRRIFGKNFRNERLIISVKNHVKSFANSLHEYLSCRREKKAGLKMVFSSRICDFCLAFKVPQIPALLRISKHYKCSPLHCRIPVRGSWLPPNDCLPGKTDPVMSSCSADDNTATDNV